LNYSIAKIIKEIKQRENPIQFMLITPKDGTINNVRPFINLLVPSITAIIADFEFGRFFIYGFSLRTKGIAVLI